jgi:pimeloyl-ACP methyl ester carboxylesterase
MLKSVSLEREGTRLTCQLCGDGSPAVLLLHGFAGYAGEWSETAERIGERHRVVALDSRAHGGSEGVPDDLSLSAQMADAAYLIRHLGLARCAVVGQSFGGVIAILLAAHHPDLVRELVVVEATPMTPDADGVERNRAWLAGWPVPFPSREAAALYFEGLSLRGDTWAGGLEERGDGWWPQFDPDVLVEMLTEASGRTFWKEWASITCPTLIVRGEEGTMSREAVTQMLELPGARLEVVAKAGHDVHLEQTKQWCELLEDFLMPAP